MSKNLKKFKKNDYSYEDEDHVDNRSNYLEKKQAKRISRALKTKDISALMSEDEGDETDYFSQQDYHISLRDYK
ncbi:hypothetical protein UFOVP787_198 [uncultured Caudovirales phage]|uniref:Uncharacterized protein n=1 Tax=uncultured Caudovirales phage TaxID=2100421 RepID=A0A6J5P601_9CAUD|nr:hypothetical protein UFOVP787_198 [uncultured Caudovirales phage]